MVDDTDETRERAKTILFAFQRKFAGCRSWTHAQKMIRWPSSYNYIMSLCKGIASLLAVCAITPLTQMMYSHNIKGFSQKQWSMFAKCLSIADRFDMCRNVYQYLDQGDIWTEIVSLQSNERGEILDLWQSVSTKSAHLFMSNPKQPLK